jgi:hypothetical protein
VDTEIGLLASHEWRYLKSNRSSAAVCFPIEYMYNDDEFFTVRRKKSGRPRYETFLSDTTEKENMGRRVKYVWKA